MMSDFYKAGNQSSPGPYDLIAALIPELRDATLYLQDILPDRTGRVQHRFRLWLEGVLRRVKAGEFPPAKVAPKSL